MLPKSELKQIARMGRLSQECATEAQFADIMTHELMALFDSGSAVFLEMQCLPGDVTLSSCTSYAIDNAHGLAYQSYYHREDPCYQRLRGLIAENPQSSVSTDRVIESEYRYINSHYYQDFLQATGIHKSLIFTLAGNQKPVGLVGLHRRKNHADYTESDHLKAQLVAPYLSTAVMFRQQERLLKQQGLLKHSILKSSNIDSYLLFNDKLICIGASGTERMPLLKSVEPELVLGMHCNSLLPTQLSALVRKKQQSEDSKGLLSEPFDNLVRASHVRVETIICDSGEVYVLFLLLKNDIELVCEQRMEYFNLTHRQKEIVHLVQLGFTNPQISAALDITAKTVENHLTQIYAKTYTHNKTSLLRQLHV